MEVGSGKPKKEGNVRSNVLEKDGGKEEQI